MRRRIWAIGILLTVSLSCLGLAYTDIRLGQYRTGLTIGNVAVQKFVSKTGTWPTNYDELAASYGLEGYPASVENVAFTESNSSDTLEVLVTFKGVLGRTLGFRHRRGIPGCATF